MFFLLGIKCLCDFSEAFQVRISKPLCGHFYYFPYSNCRICRRKNIPVILQKWLQSCGSTLAFLWSFTRFVVECVQTARKGFETDLWMASRLRLLMGRDLEETRRGMISNRNPHSRHTSSGPQGRLPICKCEWANTRSALQCFRLFYLSSLSRRARHA